MRLVTRADLDGLTCAALISINETIDSIELIHPQDITDGHAEIGPEDILANVPYHTACAMWFDHHQHTATPAAPPKGVKGAFGQAPSAARLVYEYYGGEETMPQYAELVRETDRLDSANLTVEDIDDPRGYILLGFTLDGRTGLGAFRNYFLALVDLLVKGIGIEAILDTPEVRIRREVLEEQDATFRKALEEHSRVVENVVVTDFRHVEPVPVGNRFLIYALFPEVNVSVRLQWGPEKRFQVATLGHSILNRTCTTDVGELAARYGGGGHRGAGSIPLMEEPDQQVQMILAELTRNG